MARITFNANGSYATSGTIYTTATMGAFWTTTTGTDRRVIELDVSQIAGGVPFTVEQNGALIVAGLETDDVVKFDVTIGDGTKATIAVDVTNGERREITLEGRG